MSMPCVLAWATLAAQGSVEWLLELRAWWSLLQVDREEVRLRRTIGLKKDEFSLDRKHITCAQNPWPGPPRALQYSK